MYLLFTEGEDMKKFLAPGGGCNVVRRPLVSMIQQTERVEDRTSPTPSAPPQCYTPTNLV